MNYYYIFSGEACDKSGYCVYEFEGKEYRVTCFSRRENWKDNYLWPDAKVVLKTENPAKFVKSYYFKKSFWDN